MPAKCDTYLAVEMCSLVTMGAIGKLPLLSVVFSLVATDQSLRF